MQVGELHQAIEQGIGMGLMGRHAPASSRRMPALRAPESRAGMLRRCCRRSTMPSHSHPYR
jgi:hypothetical protein